MTRPLLTLPLLAAAGPALAQTLDEDRCAARAALESYYADIDGGDYAAAYALWGDEGRASGQSYDTFAAGFAQTADTQVFTGPVPEPEGAAGSLYVEIPVRVEATLEDGTEQSFGGSYTMRRSNGVPGGDPDWTIESADLTGG